VQLTLVAMLGGIALGTLLALMRLSGKRWLVMPAAFYVNTLRSIPLVMVILWFFLLIRADRAPLGAEVSAMITFTVFEAAYYSRSCAPASRACPRAGYTGYAVGMTTASAYGCRAAQIHRNMRGAADDDHPVQDTSLVTRSVPTTC
jgi:glutamate/aspartate transport system permease protein